MTAFADASKSARQFRVFKSTEADPPPLRAAADLLGPTESISIILNVLIFLITDKSREDEISINFIDSV